MKQIAFILSFMLFFLSANLQAAEAMLSKSAEGAQVYFIQPKDGETVSQGDDIVFGLSGMGVAPAGVNVKNTGHHHLLVNLDELPDMTRPLPATDNVRHFGMGQTQTRLKLEPGTYTLQLLLGNYLHIPHDEPVLSEKITITVK